MGTPSPDATWRVLGGWWGEGNVRDGMGGRRHPVLTQQPPFSLEMGSRGAVLTANPFGALLLTGS